MLRTQWACCAGQWVALRRRYWKRPDSFLLTFTITNTLVYATNFVLTPHSTAILTQIGPHATLQR
eukprot:2609954-Pleurochrysis_carterae.AAC.1